MHNRLCTLCGIRPATKLNSHIIPSFMIARVCSYDGSSKRDKEVMFTMSSFGDKVYTGQIPSTKIEELFDVEKLTDERIDNELKDNTATKDNIFCPECEKNLSIYLESPYADYMHNGKQVDGITAYFFWMSIVWRMSISQQFNFQLPQELEIQLSNEINAYINAKLEQNSLSINELIGNCLFRYRLITSPDYLLDKETGGYFGGVFDYTHKILSLTMGDKILCVTFNNDELPASYSYLGFESELNQAIINMGMDNEQYICVSKERFKTGIHQFIAETAFKRLHNEKELADAIWQKVGLPGMEMPDVIFELFMENLYSEKSKQGDRKTVERYVNVFNETLQSLGFQQRDK